MHVWTRASKQCEFCFYLLDNFIREKCACGWYSFENIANYCSGKLHCILYKSPFQTTLLQIDVQGNFLQAFNPEKSFQIVVLGNFWAHKTNYPFRQFLLANFAHCSYGELLFCKLYKLLFRTTCLRIVVPGEGFCKLLFLTSPCKFLLRAILWHITQIDIPDNLFVKFANCSSGQLFLQIIQIVVLNDFICKFCKLS